MPSQKPPHLILGAGLAGLSAAYHLEESYDIFEAEPQVGGVARSFTLDGFTFDHAIHVLYTKDPYATTLIRSLLQENFVEQQRSSWIYSHDTFTPYPYQANTYGLPDSVIHENLIGLIEARYKPQNDAITNFEEWTVATFGRGIAQNFMLPFNRKVWATEPSQMGFEWIADRVILPNLDQIFLGAFQPSTTQFGPNAAFWYPRKGGTDALPRAFLPHLAPVRTEMRCVHIDAHRHLLYFANGENHGYETLISTLPLFKIINLLSDVPPPIRICATLLRANRVLTINLGIDRPNISDKHWVYFPEEKFEFHRISFPMNFASGLVPAGTSSIMVEISESDTRIIERHGVLQRTIVQLIEAGILQINDTVLCSKIVEIDPAYIIYNREREQSVNAIQAYLQSLNIISCGRFGEWKYLNMDQAILSGKRAAESAMSRSSEVKSNDNTKGVPVHAFDKL